MRGSKIGQKRRDGSDFFSWKREADVSFRASGGLWRKPPTKISTWFLIEYGCETLILLHHNDNVYLFYRIYCPGSWLASELLSSSCWLLSCGRLNDQLQSTNNRGFKLLLGTSRCSGKWPCLANACHLDQTLPIKPDLRADGLVRWMPQTSPLAAHSLNSVFRFGFSKADIKRKVDPGKTHNICKIGRQFTSKLY